MISAATLHGSRPGVQGCRESAPADGAERAARPHVVMLGIVVRTAVAQNEERRRLVETLAAAERRAGVLEERQRLSREIHDTLAQGYAAILAHLSHADLASGGSSEPMRPHLAFAQSVARENLEEARRMMRALRPEVLEQSGGLAAALARVAAEWAERTGVACSLRVTGTVIPLNADLEVMLLRATQELLTNVRKHARATCVTVTLSADVLAFGSGRDVVAADAAALISLQGWDSAHVVGHSLGGPIALELALSAPERVRSLALLCTVARGRDATRLSRRMVWLGLRSSVGTRRMRRRAFLEIVLPRDALPRGDADALARRLEPFFGHDLATRPAVAMKQLRALRAYDASSRLAELPGVPTLIVSAEHDPIAPPRFGQALAAAGAADSERHGMTRAVAGSFCFGRS